MVKPVLLIKILLLNSLLMAAQSNNTSAPTSVSISSTPTGAEIYVDQNFVGNTPSTIIIAAGKHSISIRKQGQRDWVREVTLSGGKVTLNAELVSSSSVPPSAATPGTTPTAAPDTNGDAYVFCVSGTEVPILSGPNQPPSVTNAKCGGKITTLEEEDAQSNYRKVRTQDGKVGYIASIFLTKQNYQQFAQRTTATARGAIEGFVFLITKAGDVKPARLAKVGLLPVTNESQNMINSFKNAANVLADERDKAEISGIHERSEFVEIECLKGLLILSQKLKPETFSKQTDEFGKFSFEGIPAGKYTPIVFGHGGMNAALWISTVSIEAEATNSIKMSEPVISCFDQKHTISSF